MKRLLTKKPLVTAVATGVLGLSLAMPVSASSDDLLERVRMLERELSALKAKMAEESKAREDLKAEMKADMKVASVKRAKGGDLTFGGYLKADYRYVDGDLRYQDYWRGNNPGAEDTNHTGFNVKESRLNAKYTNGDVTGFVEVDLYGGDGNEVATNSTNIRLRHAFIKTGNWLFGQFWSTFTPLKAFPEALDFGGPIVGEVFVRQPQVRYTNGNFSIALENPETWGDGDVGVNKDGIGVDSVTADTDEKYPDLVLAYNFKGDWGEVQVGALGRKIEDINGDKDTVFAANVGGLLKVGERDDFRFQVNLGKSGRYIGAGMVEDYVLDPDDGDIEAEKTTAFTAAYRHFWNADWRSTLYYGHAKTDVVDLDRSHWGLNLIRQLTPNVMAGIEIGNYSVDSDDYNAKDGNDGDSDYVQVSWKYTL